MKRLILLVSAAIGLVASLSAQTALPTKLVQVTDLVHEGSFTLPNAQDTTGTYEGARPEWARQTASQVQALAQSLGIEVGFCNGLPLEAR